MTKSNSDAHRKTTKKPYNERNDLEKLQSQWTKLSGLHTRDEPSAAIVRCATAAEIAANYAVRTEWSQRTQFDAAIVDQFLRWANGLPLKVERLFVPVYRDVRAGFQEWTLVQALLSALYSGGDGPVDRTWESIEDQTLVAT